MLSPRRYFEDKRRNNADVLLHCQLNLDQWVCSNHAVLQSGT